MYYLTSNEWIQKILWKRGGMSFLTKDNSVLDKYNEIWNKMKNILNIKFQSIPVYDKNT